MTTEIKARIDADRTAVPKTRLVGHLSPMNAADAKPGVVVRVGLAYRIPPIGYVADEFTGTIGTIEGIDGPDVRIETTRGTLLWVCARRLEPVL